MYNSWLKPAKMKSELFLALYLPKEVLDKPSFHTTQVDVDNSWLTSLKFILLLCVTYLRRFFHTGSCSIFTQPVAKVAITAIIADLAARISLAFHPL